MNPIGNLLGDEHSNELCRARLAALAIVQVAVFTLALVGLRAITEKSNTASIAGAFLATRAFSRATVAFLDPSYKPVESASARGPRSTPVSATPDARSAATPYEVRR